MCVGVNDRPTGLHIEVGGKGVGATGGTDSTTGVRLQSATVKIHFHITIIGGSDPIGVEGATIEIHNGRGTYIRPTFAGDSCRPGSRGHRTTVDIQNTGLLGVTGVNGNSLYRNRTSIPAGPVSSG